MDVFNTFYRGKSIPIAAPSPLMAVTTRLKIEGDLAKYWSLIHASPEDKLPTGEKVRRFRSEGYLQDTPKDAEPVYQWDQSPKGYSVIRGGNQVYISEKAMSFREAQKKNMEDRKRLAEAGPLPPHLQALADDVAEMFKMPIPKERPTYKDPRVEAIRFRQMQKEVAEADKEEARLNNPKPNITERKRRASDDPNQPNLLDLFG